MQSETREIVVCAPCEGNGWTSESRVTSNKGDRFVTHKKCDHCDGEGLFLKIITTVLTPFKRKEMPKDYSY